MTIPTTGTFTSTDIKNEWGYGLPFTSAQVASSAGLNPPWTSDNLRGKSARSISIYIASGGTIQDFGGGPNGRTQHDRIVFGVQINGGGTPSSYQWGGDLAGNGSTVQFDGPSYNLNGFTYQQTGYVDVTVIIGGQTYTASLSFTFTAGDQI